MSRNRPEEQVGRPFLRRALRNFFVSGFGSASNCLIGLLFAGLSIRYLGEARAGFLMAVAALTGLGTIVGDLGLGTAAVKQVACLNATGAFNKARRVVGSVSSLGFLSSLSIGGLLCLSAKWIVGMCALDAGDSRDAEVGLYFSLAAFVLTQTSSAWRSCYGALERYDLSSVLNTTFGLLHGLLGMALLMREPTIAALALMRFALVSVRLLVDGVVVARLLGGGVCFCFDWREVRPLAGLSAWAFLENLGGILGGRLNSLVLTSFLGSGFLPFYELPQRIVSQVQTVITSQSQFLLPMIASCGSGSRAVVLRLEDRLLWLVALGSVCIYTCIALAAPAALSQLVNPRFGEWSKIPVYIACIQGVFQALAIVPYYSCYGMGCGKPNAAIQLAQGVLISTTAAVLIPRVGLLGACVAHLWISITTMSHIIWMRRLVRGASSEWGWLTAFASPAAFAGVCLCASWLLRTWLGQHGVALSGSILGGAVLGFGIVVLIERSAFPGMQRLTTLYQLIAYPAVWIRFRFGRRDGG